MLEEDTFDTKDEDANHGHIAMMALSIQAVTHASRGQVLT